MRVNPADARLQSSDVVWCLAESEAAAAAALAAETAADGSDWRITYEDLRREAHLDEEEERVAMARVTLLCAPFAILSLLCCQGFGACAVCGR